MQKYADRKDILRKELLKNGVEEESKDSVGMSAEVYAKR